jgi:hypothetical protein
MLSIYSKALLISQGEELLPRVFTEVTFWNSAEYGISCGSDFTFAESSTV